MADLPDLIPLDVAQAHVLDGVVRSRLRAWPSRQRQAFVWPRLSPPR